MDVEVRRSRCVTSGSVWNFQVDLADGGGFHGVIRSLVDIISLPVLACEERRRVAGVASEVDSHQPVAVSNVLHFLNLGDSARNFSLEGYSDELSVSPHVLEVESLHTVDVSDTGKFCDKVLI